MCQPRVLNGPPFAYLLLEARVGSKYRRSGKSVGGLVAVRSAGDTAVRL